MDIVWDMLFQRHLDVLSSYRFLLTELPFRHSTIISVTIWCIRKCLHSHILGGAVYSEPLFCKYSLFHSMRFWDASEVTKTLSPNLRFTICLILGDLCTVALLLSTSFATISVHLSKESFVDYTTVAHACSPFVLAIVSWRMQTLCHIWFH